MQGWRRCQRHRPLDPLRFPLGHSLPRDGKGHRRGGVGEAAPPIPESTTCPGLACQSSRRWPGLAPTCLSARSAHSGSPGTYPLHRTLLLFQPVPERAPRVSASWPQGPHTQKASVSCPEGSAFPLRQAAGAQSNSKNGARQSIQGKRADFPASVAPSVEINVYGTVLGLPERECPHLAQSPESQARGDGSLPHP